MMYVVRRAFRNYGQMMAPGSVVEPGSIKRFKSRLNDKSIVEVSEHNFDMWDKYFRERMGVAIAVPEEPETDEVKTDEVKTDEVKTDEAKTDEVKPEEVKATKVTKEAKPIAVVKPVSK